MEEKSCLLRLANDGDKNAFDWLYEKYAMQVFYYAYAILRSREAAEEIVNDIFVKLWSQRARLSDIVNFQGYLFRIVRNHSLSYLRDYGRENHLDLDDITAEHIRFVPSPEDVSLSKELRSQLTKAIDQLPPQCKLIFKLIKEDGMKYKTVADLLDVSVKTVEVHMTTALKRIRSAMHTYYRLPQ